MSEKKPNVILFGVDSLRADHLGVYGYWRNTSPHIAEFAAGGTIFENNFSPHIPTTSGYANMLTGTDCFRTQIVALRHKGPMAQGVRPIQTILKEAGYTTTCVGFESPSAVNFDKYISFEGWGLEKAENLNAVAIPELERLAGQDQPFFLFMRHMDPHSPYLPPAPFDRIFYHGDEKSRKKSSMKPVMDFKPFCDYFASWMPEGVTDAAYEVAQYDGAVTYMDACMQKIFTAIEELDLVDDTIIVFTADHGETLDEHECWFDHHGTYDNTLHVPLIIRYPPKVPANTVVSGYTQLKDIVPTILDLADIRTDDKFDGSSVLPLALGEELTHASEFYFTECTWMRKHGWRTPEWKLILALEPDFHFKPPVELYNLLTDPLEEHNVAGDEPDVVKFLASRLEAWIEKRTKETGNPAPVLNQPGWHGIDGIDYFESSQQAYDTLHIGTPGAAQKLQQKALEAESK
jgi:arylsulfatase A-like enzyme